MRSSRARGTPGGGEPGGGLPEVVEDGRNGLLVPPDDPRHARRRGADRAATRVWPSGWAPKAVHEPNATSASTVTSRRTRSSSWNCSLAETNTHQNRLRS